jgi:predicted amidohydrolase
MQRATGVTAWRRFVACAFITLVAILNPAFPVHAEVPFREPTPQVQLVAVQMTLSLDDYWTKGAFEAKIRQQMDAVAAATDPDLPTLVVFPEVVGLMLVVQGMQRRLAGIDSIEQAIGKVVTSHVVPLAWTRLIRWKPWVPALLLNKNRLMAEAYFEVFSDMAREHEVYLVAGSAVLPPYRIEGGVVQWQKGPEKHRIHNTSYLFGPDGLVIGKQDKVFLIELEEEAALNLNAGSLESLQVFDTPVGRIGIAICLDGFSDEVVDRLVGQGAQILVQPSANPGEWDAWQQEDWLRGSHQKTVLDGRFAYAINPMLNGPLWDVAFYGQSSIISRITLQGFTAEHGYLDLDPAGGFISLAASDRSEEVLVAVVPHPDYLD